MALKSIYSSAVGVGPVPLYTVPAGKTATIKMLSVTPNIGNQLSSTVGANINKNIPLVNGFSLPTNGYAKLIDDFCVLNENDTLYVENFTPMASVIQSGRGLPGNISALLVNDAGTIFIAHVTGFGFYRSTDEGNTWELVLNAVENIVAWAYINNTFFFYKFTGGSLSSTDNGTTWNTNNSANTPNWNVSLSPNGRISKNSSGVYAGTNGSYALYTSDGLNWNVDNTAIPSGTITSLVWSGYQWVASVSNGSCAIYTKATLGTGSWAAQSSVNTLNFSLVSSDSEGIATFSGKLVACRQEGGLYVSTDGGVSWMGLTNYYTSGNMSMHLFLNDVVIGSGGTGSMPFYMQPLTLATTHQYGILRMHAISNIGTYICNGKIYGVYNNYMWKVNSLNLLSDINYGVTFHLSLSET